MPYRGKPSKNCADCRRRKIKCDLKVPGCTQCSNAGLECSGYRNQLDLMFLDENERTEKSVLKRSNYRKTPSDTETTSSAPSRRSSPALSTILDAPITAESWRNASAPARPRRSPSVGPQKSIRTMERKISRTTTPEEGERTGAKSRAASKAATRRRAVSTQQGASGNYLQPFDNSDTLLPQQFASATEDSSANFDLNYGQQFGFDVGSSSIMGTPYSQGSSNASIPSLNMPLHFDMSLDEPLNFGMPTSGPPMQVYNSPPQFQGPQLQPMAFFGNMGYEQRWDCGLWVHDVQPAQQMQQMPSDEEWTQWGEYQSNTDGFQQQPRQ